MLHVLSRLSSESAASGGDAASASKGLGASIRAAGLAPVYKLQGSLKERLQLRRTGAALHTSAEVVAGLPPTSNRPDSVFADDSSLAAAAEALADATAAFEAISSSCFEAWCHEAGVPADEALQQFGDAGYAPSSCSGKGKSVLNIYNYFNEQSCDEEPCREHADPGLLTMLCRSTNAALQVRLPLPDETADQASDYEDVWRDVESAMDAAAKNAQIGSSHGNLEASGFVLLVIVGETLERLSGKRLAACQHRVARAAGTRLNMAYEMRPRVNVWHPWKSSTQEPETQ